MADKSPFQLIFEDEDEIQRVLEIIKEQFTVPLDYDQSNHGRGMGTAHYLAGLLRQELIDHGGAKSSEIKDPKEIVHWYMVEVVKPGQWQFDFADCLASLELYFLSPYGPPKSATDFLHVQGEIDHLEAKCRAVMRSDHLRHATHENQSLKTKASTLSEYLEAIKPDAERGKKQQQRLKQMRGAALVSGWHLYSDSEKEAWRRFDEGNVKKAHRVLNGSDRVRAVIEKFSLPEKASRTVRRALFPNSKK